MTTKLTDLNRDIAGPEIGKYLKEEERSTLERLSKTTQGLFQRDRHQEMANKLLLQVIRGEQDKAEKILKIRPDLLLMTGTATDYSGRTFATTAFRAALWALDTRYMCNMMLDCIPVSQEGEAIKQGLMNQFKTHAAEGLDYELNGVTIHETHYDFSPIKAALKTYVDNYPNWSVAVKPDAMVNQWCKVVGLAQRYVPAHVAQHYCDRTESFYPTPAFNKKTFVRRDLYFYNVVQGNCKDWFDTTSGLGVDFAIAAGDIHLTGPCARTGHRNLLVGVPGSLARVELAALTQLCAVRTRDLVPLMQRLGLEGPGMRLCVIS